MACQGNCSVSFLSLSLSSLPQLWLLVNFFFFLLQLLGLFSGARALFPLKCKSCSAAHILISMTKGQAWGCRDGKPPSFLLEPAGGRAAAACLLPNELFDLRTCIRTHSSQATERATDSCHKYCARTQVCFCVRMMCMTQKWMPDECFYISFCYRTALEHVSKLNFLPKGSKVPFSIPLFLTLTVTK